MPELDRSQQFYSNGFPFFWWYFFRYQNSCVSQEIGSPLYLTEHLKKSQHLLTMFLWHLALSDVGEEGGGGECVIGEVVFPLVSVLLLFLYLFANFFIYLFSKTFFVIIWYKNVILGWNNLIWHSLTKIKPFSYVVLH